MSMTTVYELDRLVAQVSAPTNATSNGVKREALPGTFVVDEMRPLPRKDDGERR